MRKDQTMKRKRHTEEQIIAILKEHEAGMKTADLCRKHGISVASFYNWKAKYGGLEVSEAKRLRGLESENARLNKLLADAMLDTWRADYNHSRPHSRLGWMSPAIYAAQRRSAALLLTDGSAPRTAAITAQMGNVEPQTPIAAG